MALQHSLLDEPLIRARLVGSGQPVQYSLPGLFVALARDEVRDFPALRPHQRHPWHAFLVQLAAMTLHDAGQEKPFETEQEWKDALLALTPEHPDGAAWCLISSHDKPAFMQAPVPDGNVDDWENDRPTPDSLDILVTSKNHDLKQARIYKAHPDDWIFSLVSLQTAGPFPGRGNYGVTRMNGGSSSRPGIGVAPPGGLGNRWMRDVIIALENREKIVRENTLSQSNGIGLMWVVPWDGSEASSLPFPSLDPFFIEICRRIRLVNFGQEIHSRRTTSNMRVVKAHADALKGRTGDLWTPIDIKEEKSFGMSETGFAYKKMAQLAFGSEYKKSPAQCIHANDSTIGLTLLARAISGGQSETSGYYERRIPIPPKMRTLLKGNTDLLATLSSKRFDAIAGISKCLKMALITLFDGGKLREKHWKAPKGIEEKGKRFTKPFEQAEDARFFDDLNIEIESEDSEDVFSQWLSAMSKRGEMVLQSAFDTGPRSGEQRYRARSIALGKFRVLVKYEFPTLANYYRHTPPTKENAHEPV